MKEMVLNEKSETAIYLISTILQGYCKTIYSIYEKEPETAMNVLNGEILSEILYDVLIAYEVEECEKDGIYKDLSDINVDEIKEMILYWHKEHIIKLVLKNIKQDDTDGPIYWKLKMTVNRH
ncbi:hypothetical protein CS369_21045 [Candidatus Symbiopectobacterium sp. 'North America']|uniref:hypothetical protein n=1 Tax=Candidatus Symbiopectobacterium sp. 'North America' TaxID=2794574 RepID=UPI0018CB706A|nr:hypothetical protein [Candidatus Symbiopectobacterium sp. 'North America']MBG6246584.1 hypothetical protein [Candidatus Symbiopectobacterium sp. 'North America']